MDQQPAGRRALAHTFQAFAAPPAVLTDPYLQPVLPVYPDQLRGRPARAHEMQAWAGPKQAVVAPTPQPIQPIIPLQQLRGRPSRAHEYQAIGKPGTFVTPVTPAIAGYGALGVATFVLALEPGARVTYSWSTSITTSYDGSEQRESLNALPMLRFEGGAFLLDGSERDARGALMRGAASGATFLLALPHEELSISADSPNTTISVVSTARCDWALPGQRAVVVGKSGTAVNVVVQSKTSTTISIVTLDANGNFAFGTLGAIGGAGGRVMPLLQVLLEPQQGFARYPQAVGLWSVRAKANVFGWAGVDSMGLGTSITTMTAGEPVAIASIVDADVLVWDRVNEAENTASEALMSRADLVDLGALPFGIGGAPAPAWSRALRMRSSSADDWQYLKAFVRHVRGQQVPFFLSTNRADLVYDSAASVGMKIKSASTAGGGDYVSWFASAAHRRLAVVVAGVTSYVLVTAVADNHDGTLTLTLDSPVSGTPSRISFLEQVRLATDDIAVTWDGWTFDAQLVVTTVQESVSIPVNPVFDTVIETGQLTFPITPPKQLSAALGNTTLINFTSDRSLNIGSLHNTGAGGNQDGMVVCFKNANNSAFGMTIVHEDTSSTSSDRLVNAGLADVGSSGFASWYRYHGTKQRWIQFWST